MIKIIVLSLLLITSCSRQIRSCEWGDCANGWGKSTIDERSRACYDYVKRHGRYDIEKCYSTYEGSHKDGKWHGGGYYNKAGYNTSMSGFRWTKEGEVVYPEHSPLNSGLRTYEYGPEIVEIALYYKQIKESHDKAKSTIPNKWDAIIDDGQSIFRQNISGFPDEVQGKWVIFAVSFNQGKDTLETGKVLGTAYKDQLDIWQRGLGTPDQSLAQNFTTYVTESRTVTKSQIWRHNGQEGVILIELNTVMGKMKYQLYDLDYEVKKPFAPRKKNGTYLVIHYDGKDREIARFIVEIQ